MLFNVDLVLVMFFVCGIWNISLCLLLVALLLLVVNRAFDFQKKTESM